jgi:predicted DNA binding CopG/RHH family protein
MTKMKPKNSVDAGIPTRTPHAVLAEEASDWDNRRRDLSGFADAETAVPREQEATAISLRMPKALLALLKKFAEREGVGYQVLIKRWLDERVRLERERLRGARSGDAASRRCNAPQFPLMDRDGESGHYRH